MKTRTHDIALWKKSSNKIANLNPQYCSRRFAPGEIRRLLAESIEKTACRIYGLDYKRVGIQTRKERQSLAYSPDSVVVRKQFCKILRPFGLAQGRLFSLRAQC